MNMMADEPGFSAADLQFLTTSNRMLAASPDPSTILETLARRIVGRFAEWCVIDRIVEGSADVERFILHADAALEPALRQVAVAIPSIPAGPLFPSPLESEPMMILSGLPGFPGAASQAGGPDTPVAILRLQFHDVLLGGIALRWRTAPADLDVSLLRLLVDAGAAALYGGLGYHQRVLRSGEDVELLKQQMIEAREKYIGLVESMRKIEVRVRRLFDANVIGLIFSDIHGNIVDANDAFLSMVGYTREDLVGGAIRWTDLTPPEHAGASRNAIDELQRLGVCTPFEKEYFRRDGGRVPVLLGAALLEGQREHVVAFVLDLSDRRRTEQALVESEKRNRALLSAIPDLMFRIDNTGKFIDVVANEGGYARVCSREMLGCDPHDVLPGDLADLITLHSGLVLTSGETQRFEYRSEEEQGMLYYETRLVLSGENEVLGIVRDITEAKTAEEEIRKREQLFRAVIDNSWDCIWLIAADGTIFYASPSTAALLGYAPEQMIGRNRLEFLHEEDQELMAAQFRQLLTLPGTRVTAQYRIRHSGGGWLWMEGGETNLLENPGVRGVICTFRDISERKHVEEELRSRARQQAAIAEFGLEALAGADIDVLLEAGVRIVARILDVEFCKFLELLPGERAFLLRTGVGWDDELIGVATVPMDPESQAGYTLLSSEPVVFDELKSETRFAGTQLLHGHGIISGVSVIVHGPTAPYGIVGAHTTRRRKFNRDDVNFMQAIANIISEALVRKEAEVALHTSEKHFRALIEHSYDATALVACDGSILYASPSTTRVLGYAVEEFSDANFFDLMHPDDFPFCRELFDEVFTGERNGRTVQYRKLHRDGFWRWVEGTWAHFATAAGEKAIIANYHDITERKDAELALNAAKEAAEAASRAKDQFLAVLSHELRTPLTPVLASVQVLMQEPEFPAALDPYVEIIRRNVELEARLIDDLLDLTRITRGKLELNHDVVDAHALLHTVEEICSGDVRTKQLTIMIEPEAERHHILGDSARLQQVLWNLVQNAVKFTPEGGTVVIRSSNPKPGRLRLEVIDTGIGIDRQLLPRIFDAFEQGERSITRRFGGLGLGLAISRMLMNAHGGTLTAASEGRDRGATFTVEMDVVSPEAGVADAAGMERQDHEGSYVHILLVDDHSDTNTVMKMLLERRGYRVSTADSVSSALELASCTCFDLLISDIGLPDGSGLDIMRELHARSGIRGIALSGFGMEDDVRRSLEAGFAEHLTKPVSFQKLLQAIHDILG